MKKITHLIIVLFFCSFSYGQVQLSSLMNSTPVNKTNSSQSVFPQAPCSIGTPSNNLETALGSFFEPSIFANDFYVDANEVFTPEKLVLNMYVPSGESIDGVDVFFYQHGNNRPGDELGSELAIVPSSQSIIATVDSLDVLEVTVDLSNPVALSSGSTGSLYWVGVKLPFNWYYTYFEMTTILNTPNETYVGDGIGWGAVSSSGLPEFDQVLALSGDCSVLGINDNITDLVSIYPNPTSGILNLKLSTSVEVKNVTMFDMLGKNTGVSYNDGVVDASYLSQGVYLLKVETTAGIVAQKIVKQ